MRISDWSSDVCSSDLEEVQRPLDPKPLLVPEAAHGRARRQPQRHFGQQIAQVIGTARPLHRAPAPVPDRAKAHADAGAARYRPDDPREGDGPIGAAVAAEAWAEVDHLYRIAARIGMARDEDGRAR